MFCSHCGKPVANESNYCHTCGGKLGSSSSQGLPSGDVPKKPILATAVTVILSGSDLIWSFLRVTTLLWLQPSDSIILFRQLFPSAQVYSMVGSSVAILANSALLIGAWLAYYLDSRGVKIIRLTAKLRIVWAGIATHMYLRELTSNANWEQFNSAEKGGVIGATIGAGIGALLSMGLVLYLYRDRKLKL